MEWLEVNERLFLCVTTTLLVCCQALGSELGSGQRGWYYSSRCRAGKNEDKRNLSGSSTSSSHYL